MAGNCNRLCIFHPLLPMKMHPKSNRKATLVVVGMSYRSSLDIFLWVCRQQEIYKQDKTEEAGKNRVIKTEPRWINCEIE